MNGPRAYERARLDARGGVIIADRHVRVGRVVAHHPPANDTDVVRLEHIRQRQQVIGARIAVVVRKGEDLAARRRRWPDFSRRSAPPRPRAVPGQGSAADAANCWMSRPVSSAEAWSTISSSHPNGTRSRPATALRNRGNREARLRVQTIIEIFTPSSADPCDCSKGGL